MANELESGLLNTLDWGRKWLVHFNAGKTQLILFDNALMWKWLPLFSRRCRDCILRCRDCLSLINWINFTLSQLLKLPQKHLQPWFVLWIFFFSEVPFYLYRSTEQPCTEYFCHVPKLCCSCCSYTVFCSVGS